MSQIILTEADAEKVSVALQGEQVVLRLPETRSTGYRWSVEISPPEAAAVEVSHWTAVGQGPGAPGAREFTLRVAKKGEVTLSAKLWREWEGNASQAKRMTFTLEVQ